MDDPSAFLNDDGLKVINVVLGSGDKRGCGDDNNSDKDGSVKLVPCIGITGDDDTTSRLVGKDAVLEATCADALAPE